MIAGTALLLAGLLAPRAFSQQTIFNVPSPDVLEQRVLYFENDWYARPWSGKEDRALLTYIRGVRGFGSGVEGGINVGAFDLLHEDAAFVDAALKWALRPHSATIRSREVAFGFYSGAHIGIGIGGSSAGLARNLSYAASYASIPSMGLRLAAGPYFATRHVFGDTRGGALLTVEKKLPSLSGLTLAADWFSGEGAYATTGLIYSVRDITVYLGYGFANTHRRDDLLTFEIGFTRLPKR